MAHHFFKTVWRRLKSEKGFTIINIVGLGAGLACAILVLVYVRHNLGFDRFHDDADRIYRVISNGLFIDYPIHQTGTPAILAQTLRQDHGGEFLVTQVREFRFRSRMSVVQADGRSFFDARLCLVDSEFLKVFSFPLLAGDGETVLRDPRTAVLTRSSAARYFGGRDPLGRTLVIDEEPYRVTGLIEDVPDRSHIQFDGLLGGAQTSQPATSWTNNNHSTYVRLREGATEARLAAVLDGLVKQHVAPRLETPGNWWAYDLEPLPRIHLHSDLPAPYGVNGSASSVTIISFMALLILLIAGANFVNLTTARLARRSRGVGIRKVIGSGRRSIVFEFLGEAVLLSGAGLVLALALSAAMLPALSRLVGQPLRPGIVSEPVLMAAILGGPWIVGLLAGLYPALSLASCSPLKTIHGAAPSGGGRKPFLRNALIVFQFTISIFLFVTTGVLAGQLRFLQAKNLGFDREHVIVLHNAGIFGGRADAFKNELRRRTDVVGVAETSALPGTRMSSWYSEPEGLAATSLNVIVGDPDLVDVLKLETVQGRFLDADRADEGSLVLNEEAARRFAWPDAVGKRIEVNGEMMTVVGVVRDFHYESLHSQLEPLGIMSLTRPRSRNIAPLFAVRIAPGRLPDTIDGIRGTWERLLPGVPFTYTFLDDDYGRLYAGERRTAAMSTASAGLAILVSCLGLLGLAAYAAESRRKEIGIRKVLGATAGRIVSLFSGELLKGVLLANLLAWPIAYWALSAWLNGFAYRIRLEARFFLLAAAGALAIALLVVGGQTLRAARALPASSLRRE